MEAARKIEYHAAPRISIDVPESLQGKDLEIILFPYEQVEKNTPQAGKLNLPKRHCGKVKTSLSRSEIYDDEK